MGFTRTARGTDVFALTKAACSETPLRLYSSAARCSRLCSCSRFWSHLIQCAETSWSCSAGRRDCDSGRARRRTCSCGRAQRLGRACIRARLGDAVVLLVVLGDAVASVVVLGDVVVLVAVLRDAVTPVFVLGCATRSCLWSCSEGRRGRSCGRGRAPRRGCACGCGRAPRLR